MVVPVYNAESWIEQTLDSVRQQREDIEVIVIDDGSRDRSAEIVRSFMNQHGLNGTVLAEENSGPAHARNLGWQTASADWIQFLDADDLLAPEKLRIQYEEAVSVPADVAVLYSPWQRIGLLDGHWETLGPVIAADVDEDTVASILKDRLFGYVGPTLIRRSALEEIGGFSPEMTIGEDLDLMLRIAMSGHKFQRVPSPEPLFFYRDAPESLWHTSVTDAGAVMRLMLAIRDAENYVRRHSTEGNGPSVSTKLAIATRYAELLDVLRSTEPSDFRRVLAWISDLGLRQAPPGSRLPARSFARLAGLGNALRLQCALRHGIRSLRSPRRA